ncbi:peptidase M48 [Bacillus coahuilensis m2-6]|uniref:Peptidase M48 n=1 Tax=Bacillus coahuilensis p1.1.43 TaxID=1150625 RepID=A0A147KAN5_9BACI|nr:M48 family metallopeptidase [Bacillus coahuilensis]KUP07725.1 peptidase M48 [Bacillus coahuilensis p1.1.43]KUP09183.1 peptidase M48 [Bacillus coahuilensis m2-6]
MTAKWSFRAVFLYLVFGLFVYLYLFYIADTTLPQELKGSGADPETFMNSRELMLSEEYSRIRNLLYFLSVPYEWLFYFLLLVFGVSRTFSRWGEGTSSIPVVQTAIYLFWFYIASYLVIFPFEYLSFHFSKLYNISVQTFSAWMKDQVIDFWVNFLLMVVIISALYWIMRTFQQKWWLVAWLASIPFTIFLMFIQPVVIDPLYNDFTPLQDKELEAKILAIAEKADIPAEHVYQVDMSTKTNALNAYVTGVGANSRIVLWDTTLEALSDDEILFVMAHEMAHYVEKHIYVGIGSYLLMMLIGLWLIAKVMNRMVESNGKEYRIKKVSHISSLPLFLLLSSVLLFAASPLENGVSRYTETRADNYAIQMTQNPDAAVSAFQELSRVGLSQVNPPFLVKIFRYSHPSMVERIERLERFEPEE